MQNLISLLFFCAVFGKVMPDSVFYHDCGSEYDLDDVNITGCNKTSCILQKGKSANVYIELYGRDPDSHKLIQTVYLIFNGIRVPVPVTPSDLCATVVDCPVRGSANASFSAVMDFSKLPNVQSAVVLHWQIHNEKKDLLMCFKSNAKYENPKKTHRHN